MNTGDRRSAVPEDWGLAVNPAGELVAGGCSTVALAREYGTPLHIVDAARLEATARDFVAAFGILPGDVSVHYAFKCNGVPGVVRLLRGTGLKAEVMSGFELALAQRLGYGGSDIVVNGPAKTREFLKSCLDAAVRFIVVDSPAELSLLDHLGRERGRPVDILLRVNPDFVPHGMNQGSATASRRGCVFGFDLVGGEAEETLARLEGQPGVRWHGFHFHIGTGVHVAEDYRLALLRIRPLVERARALYGGVPVLDIGGGFAARTTREMTQLEMLVYQGIGRLPRAVEAERQPSFERFAAAVARGLDELFGSDQPELLIEPGRSITSSSQMLLLTVLSVKERRGVRKWLVTDGGLGTVTMPTFYEYHEVLLCDDPARPRTERVTITGPVCFSGDIVYRNKPMPRVKPGEVLAIMDSGAYFTALESSFGFPRPAIVTVRDGQHRLVRRRESFEEAIARDDISER